MSRTTLTASMITAIERDASTACHLISLEFSGGTLYYNTGSVDLSWDGHTWTAVGGNLSVGSIVEDKSLSAQAVRVTLDGVDQTVISPLLAQNYIGRTCQIYLVHFLTGGTVVADPYLLFEGLLNSPFEVKQTKDTCTITTRFVSPLTRFSQTRGIRGTVVSHQEHFSGDTFFRHLKGIANRKIYWGPEPIETGTIIGGGGGESDTDDPNDDDE